MIRYNMFFERPMEINLKLQAVIKESMPTLFILILGFSIVTILVVPPVFAISTSNTSAVQGNKSIVGATTSNMTFFREYDA